MEGVVPSRMMDNLMFSEQNMNDSKEGNTDTDDETEVFEIKRRKSKLSTFLRDDSDGDQNSDHDRPSTQAPCEHDATDKEEDNSELIIKKKKKKKIIRPVEDSDDDKEEVGDGEVNVISIETPITSVLSVKERLVMLAEARSLKIHSNREKEEEGRERDPEELLIDKTEYETKQLLKDDDLYDAEGSSDENRSRNDDPDDEGLENMKKKAKKSLKTRRSRQEKDDLQNLHSESQRLVRQGRVKLPYHVPQHRSLDEFLNRRKSIPNTLKPAECELKVLEEAKNSSMNVEVDSVRKRLDLDSQPVIKGLDEDPAANIVAPVPSVIEAEPIANDELPDLDCNLLPEEPGQPVESTMICNDIEPLSQISETTENTTKKTMPQDEENELTPPHDEMIEWMTALPAIVEEEVIKDAANVSFGLKQRLSLLGNEITTLTPKLVGSPQDVICLDEEDSISSQNDGLYDLMKRFVKHTLLKKKQQPVETKEVVLNILKKEMDSEGREQLKMECIKINSKPIEEPVPDDSTPGSRLKLLRESLKAQLALKREEARKQRLRLHEMDNERDGDDESDNEEEEVEEEEEILSDLTDTEESEPDDEEIEQLPEKQKKRSEFVDDEAEDEDGISDEEEDDENLNLPLKTDVLNGVLGTETIKQPSLKRCDTTELFPLSQSLSAPKSEQAQNRSLNGSFEMIGSAIPSHQPGGGFLLRKTLDFESQPTEPTQDRSEDSQSMFTQLEKGNSEQTDETQSFELSQFAKFDKLSNSNELRSSLCKKLGLEESQNNMDEVFELCSGKWTEYAKDKDLAVVPLCNSQSQNTQENEAELLGLCSGRFATDSLLSTEPTTQNAFQLNNTRSLVSDRPISDDELSISSLESVTVGRRKKKTAKRVVTDSENETDIDEIEDVDEEDEAEREKEKAAVNEFFEDEAELSGSDVPSDEDEDIKEEDDILEEELGDQDYISEDELRNQVEKVHNKLMMDEDQRQLRIYKELYLEDGELHTDGQGRTRQFKWRNVGDSQTQDGFKMSDSEGEDVEEEGVDAEFRAQRHEREKWLTEQSVSLDQDDNLVGDDSQFGKISKKITILSKHNSQVIDTPPVEQTSIKCLKVLQRRGSFLARSKEILAKIAEQTKTGDQTNLNGPRNSRNFVFAIMSPTKQDSKRAQLRRTLSTPGSMLPAAKRPRLDKRNSVLDTQSQDSSIFDLL